MQSSRAAKLQSCIIATHHRTLAALLFCLQVRRRLPLTAALVVWVMLAAACDSLGTGGRTETAFTPGPVTFTDVTKEAGLDF